MTATRTPPRFATLRAPATINRTRGDRCTARPTTTENHAVLTRGTGGGMVLTRRRLYPLFRRRDSREGRMCRYNPRLCRRTLARTHETHTRTYVRTRTRARTHMPPHVRSTTRGEEVKSDEMENTHSERTFHARRVFRLEEETGEDRRSHRGDY